MYRAVLPPAWIVVGAALGLALCTVVTSPPRPPAVGVALSAAATIEAAAAESTAIDRHDAGAPAPAARARGRAAGERARTTIAADFARSTELRSFALAARSRPHDGGAFYAAYAMAECRLRPATAPNDDASADANADHRREQARVASLERWSMRCAAFLPDELSDDALQQVIAAGAQAGDPLLAGMQAWARALEDGDLRTLRREWRTLVRAADPALREWAIRSGGDVMHAIVEMNANADEQTRAAYLQTWDAVGCELGAGCVAPRGPPDALCELLPRCARERWDVAALEPAPASPLASTVAKVRRTLDGLRR